MKKRILAFILSLMMMLTMTVSTYATGDVSVIENNESDSTLTCEVCLKDPCECLDDEVSGGNVTESSVTQVGDRVWIKKGAKVYKNLNNDQSWTLLDNYEVKIVEIETDEDGNPQWYRFDFVSVSNDDAFLHSYKYVEAADTSKEELESSAPVNGNVCNCGENVPENIADHPESCARVQYIKALIEGKAVEEIYADWESFDENTRSDILAIMEAAHYVSFQELQALLNVNVNEAEAVVDGMTIEAVGAIPEDVTMEVESIDAEALGLSPALFAYDITFLNEEGDEWQPSGSVVKVTVDAAGLGIKNGTYVRMYHIADDGSQEAVGRYLVSGGKMTFEATSFSGYVGIADGRASTSVATTDAPIVINLFDYGSLITQVTAAHSKLAVGLGGAQLGAFDYTDGLDNPAPVVGTFTHASYDGIGGAQLGTYPVLVDGYPVRSSNEGGTISLKYLFDKSLPAATKMPYEQAKRTVGTAEYSNYDVLRYPVNTGNLFGETSDGYFEFDSRDNHTWYSLDNGGTLNVEDYAVNPDYLSDRRYSGIGHFLPFNGPITQYSVDATSGDAYEMKKNGAWLNENYKSKAQYDDTYKVNNANFVNTNAETLYAIKRVATNSAKNRVNMWVGMSVEFDFNQPQGGIKNEEDMIFEFSGDDLMWVYIDNVMVLDVANSGTHDRGVGGAKTATINFKTGEVIVYKVDSSILDIQALDTNNNGFFDETERSNETFKYHVAYHTTLHKLFETAKNNGYISSIPEFNGETFADFETLSFKMFYMDSGHGTSNCSLKFNMDPLPSGNLSVKKVETELNEEFCGETEYAFELYRKTEEDSEYSKVTNATFTITGEGDAANNDLSGDVYTIGDDGIFKLKGNQTAIFTTGVTVKDTLYVKEITDGNLYTTTHTVNNNTKDGVQTDGIFISKPDDAHDVVFTNQWKTADLNIKKETIGEVGEASYSLTLSHPATSNVFSVPIKNGETVTIDNLPIGYEFTLEETDPSDGAFRYQAPTYNDQVVPFSEKYSYTIKQEGNDINIINRCLTDLRITKNLTASAKEDQSFLFNISELGMDVVLEIPKGHDSASILIKDVVVGKYTVNEDAAWSWRYEIDEAALVGNSQEQKVTLSSVAENNNVTFTNKRTIAFWLSGDSYRKNWWDRIVNDTTDDAGADG